MKKYYFLLFLLPSIGKAAQSPSKRPAPEKQSTPADSRLAQFDQETYPHLAAFLKAYPLPQEFKNVVNLCKKSPEIRGLIKQKIASYWAPPVITCNGICIKRGDITRVLNGICMAECMRKHTLDTHLGVTEKHIAHIEGTLWVVLAKAVPDQPTPKKINTPTVEKLIKLTEETGFCDWAPLRKGSPKNWHYHNEKFVCIDTAQNSFTHDVEHSFSRLHDVWDERFDQKQKDIICQAQAAAKAHNQIPLLERYKPADHDFSEITAEFRVVSES